jgi:predicted transcriptional regulator of viral defense system
MKKSSIATRLELPQTYEARMRAIVARSAATITAISRVKLQRLVKSGDLVRLRRGIYSRPDESENTQHHDLASVATSIPRGVICLLSALRFHGLGTQNPAEVWVAIHGKARKPKIEYPPVKIVRFSGPALEHGGETHQIEGVTVRVTSPAKTVADCFKFRNKIGPDIALEALREYRRARRSLDDLVQAAQEVRVANVMRPYLEALTT